MNHYCKSIGCCSSVHEGTDFCDACSDSTTESNGLLTVSLADRYPNQYRETGDMGEIDVYAVHNLFEIPDHSGCLQQASSKLLMTGTSDTVYRDIKEARDILTRWMQLNKDNQ